MKSCDLYLRSLLFSILVSAGSSNYTHQPEELRVRDVEVTETTTSYFEEDIEVGLKDRDRINTINEDHFLLNILWLHNEFRRNITDGKVLGQPRAAGLHDLIWDEGLAQLAKGTSRTCKFATTSTYEYDRIGQNIALQSSVEMGFKVWTDESRHYNYRTNRCWTYCYSYKKIVSALTKYLGCGVTECHGYHLLICNYGIGNILSGRPYPMRTVRPMRPRR
ncbi:unnamed protein product [Rodentolepis nana]|uniref:SCP domain-containing protein n=1 Tax=Rodentolepis nana TaxID=102285 RepID=A0A0R3TXC9_RODNA|nr:unnamed protein product [Rodentolepis nana]